MNAVVEQVSNSVENAAENITTLADTSSTSSPINREATASSSAVTMASPEASTRSSIDRATSIGMVENNASLQWTVTQSQNNRSTNNVTINDVIDTNEFSSNHISPRHQQQTSNHHCSQNNSIYTALNLRISVLKRFSNVTIGVFGGKFAIKLSVLQAICGILQLVSGFVLNQGSYISRLPSYSLSLMSVWTGAIYLVTAASGSAAINSKRKIAIIVFLFFGFVSLSLSIALSILVAPNLNGDKSACHGNSGNSNGTSTQPNVNPSDESSVLQCNEEQLMIVFEGISLGVALLDVIVSVVICIICGEALWKSCYKSRSITHVDASNVFYIEPDEELGETITRARRRPPEVVQLPQYDHSTRRSRGARNTPSEDEDIGLPQTPPPAYRRSIISIQQNISVSANAAEDHR